MIIILTVIALLIQFVGAYALIIQAQRTQDAGDEAVDLHNQRGQQSYYNAFAQPGSTVRKKLQIGTLDECLNDDLNLGQNVPNRL